MKMILLLFLSHFTSIQLEEHGSSPQFQKISEQVRAVQSPELCGEGWLPRGSLHKITCSLHPESDSLFNILSIEQHGHSIIQSCLCAVTAEKELLP